jgi:hypothetical protein
MAKQLGVIQYSGKLGQTVGRKKAPGQKNNGMAAYQANVTNPKTLAQRMQRIRMTPAVNFYRALSVLLDHAFQGKRYGAPCHNFFMEKAMLMETGIPYLKKGDNRPIPGMYMVSSGSLTPIDADDMLNQGATRGTTNTQLNNAPCIALSSDIEVTSTTTIGAMSAALKAAYPSLQNGDQLTFVVALSNDDEILADTTQVYYHYGRFVLDLDSTSVLKDWEDEEGFAFSNDGAYIFPLSMNDHAIMGGCIIVSRRPLRHGGAWQRSNTYFSVATEVQRQFMQNGALQAALESFAIKESEVSSDYYLNQGGSGSNTPADTPMITITVAKNPENGGTVTGAGTYESGSEITLNATPATGYYFDGWYDNNERLSSNARYSFLSISNMTIEARFGSNDQP